MKVIIYIRRDKQRPTHFTMRTDFNEERDDSPRINNLGIEIKREIDAIIERCAADGVIRVGQ